MYKYGDGGSVEEGNKHMLMNQAVQFKHHAEELMNQLKSDKKIDAWVVAKAERAATDLSDITHYLEGRNQQMAKGGMIVPYVVWVSKDGDVREFYGEFKSQRAAEMAMRRIWNNREDYHSIGMLPKSTYEKQGYFSEGGLVSDDEVLEMLELAQSSNKAEVDEARMRWERYTKAQKDEFKRLAYEGDAANEDIYEGFLYLISDENKMGMGGKVKFQDKVDAISRRLEGTKVPKRLESDYGKRYNKVESMLAARRIAGSMRKKGY